MYNYKPNTSSKKQDKLGLSKDNHIQLSLHSFLSLSKHTSQTKQLRNFSKLNFIVLLPQEEEVKQIIDDEKFEIVYFTIILQQKIQEQQQKITSDKQITHLSTIYQTQTSSTDILSKLFQSSYWQKQQKPKDSKQDKAKNLIKEVNQDLSVIRNIVATFSHKKESVDGQRRTKKIKFY